MQHASFLLMRKNKEEAALLCDFIVFEFGEKHQLLIFFSSLNSIMVKFSKIEKSQGGKENCFIHLEGKDGHAAWSLISVSQ